MNVLRKMPTLGAWLAASVTGGLLFQALGVPVAWLLGPMLASMLARTVIAPSSRARLHGATLGQWIIGGIMGTRFSIEALQAGMEHIAPLLILIVFTATLCMVNGWVLSRWAGVDYPAAFLGALPGGAASIVAMSTELDVDTLMVTVLMYVRVMLIIIVTPLLLSTVFPEALAEAQERFLPEPAQIPPLMAAVTFLIAIGAGRAARRLPLPSPNFMGPFLLVMLANILLPAARIGLPDAVFRPGLLLLGSTVGIQFDLARMKHYWKPAAVQAVLVTSLLLVCMASGYAFHLISGVDIPTAVMGTTPGGKESMVATSMEIGGNAEMVMTMQTVRWLLVLFLGPSVASWVARRTQLKRGITDSPPKVASD